LKKILKYFYFYISLISTLPDNYKINLYFSYISFFSISLFSIFLTNQTQVREGFKATNVNTFYFIIYYFYLILFLYFHNVAHFVRFYSVTYFVLIFL